MYRCSKCAKFFNTVWHVAWNRCECTNCINQEREDNERREEDIKLRREQLRLLAEQNKLIAEQNLLLTQTKWVDVKIADVD